MSTRAATTERITLDEQCWVDVTRVWLLGADTLLEELVDRVDWKCGHRRMYDRMLDDPRLSRWYGRGDARPHPAFRTMTKHLEASLGVALPTVGCNYYRDGNDSVAWHADRELRELDDTRDRDRHARRPPAVPHPTRRVVGAQSTSRRRRATCW